MEAILEFFNRLPDVTYGERKKFAVTAETDRSVLICAVDWPNFILIMLGGCVMRFGNDTCFFKRKSRVVTGFFIKICLYDSFIPGMLAD